MDCEKCVLLVGFLIGLVFGLTSAWVTFLALLTYLRPEQTGGLEKDVVFRPPYPTEGRGK